MSLLHRRHLLFLAISTVVVPVPASRSPPLCKPVHLLCNSSTSVPSPPPAAFKKSDIVVGGRITPSTLGKHLSESLLPEEPQTALNSSLAAAVLTESVAASACRLGKEAVELKVCPSAVSGMMELAMQGSGSRYLDILEGSSSSSSGGGLAQVLETEMLVTHIALRRSVGNETSIVCRAMAAAAAAPAAGNINPSVCYTAEGVQNIQMTMRTKDGADEFTLGMQCYKEREEEEERWCEWVEENTLVGVVKEEEGEEEAGAAEEDGVLGSEWMKGMKVVDDLNVSMEEKAESLRQKLGNANEPRSSAGDSPVAKMEDAAKAAATSPLGSRIVEALGV